MDGLSTWTDGLTDEVIQLLVEQQFGEYFEFSIYDTETCKNGLKQMYTEDVAHGHVWTWEDEEE
jgi:hypothetical protein